jgi:hypothetical protein
LKTFWFDAMSGSGSHQVPRHAQQTCCQNTGGQLMQVMDQHVQLQGLMAWSASHPIFVVSPRGVSGINDLVVPSMI